ncbi:MAG: ribonuclease HII, partial [Rubrobacteraceae bacterium]
MGSRESGKTTTRYSPLTTHRLYTFDAAWVLEQKGPLAGADEAGRGALAGPIFAAAVVLGEEALEGIGDSKTLSATVRERVFPKILSRAEAVSVASFPAWWIDEYGVGLANREALSRALGLLEDRAGCLLADGNLKLGEHID